MRTFAELVKLSHRIYLFKWGWMELVQNKIGGQSCRRDDGQFYRFDTICVCCTSKPRICITKAEPPKEGEMDVRFSMVLVLIARDSTYVKKEGYEHPWKFPLISKKKNNRRYFFLSFCLTWWRCCWCETEISISIFTYSLSDFALHFETSLFPSHTVASWSYQIK